MEKDFWLGRWERGETGWHQSEVEPGLVTHFPKTGPRRVLVPLCGKSLDLTWLASQGHEVVGVELSEMACRAYFNENNLAPTEAQEGPFHVFRAGGITLLQGDFFALSPEILGPIDAIYDRAALIALPPELRKNYSILIQKLVRTCARPNFVHLQIVLERSPQDDKGPPFSIPEQELERLYGGFYRRETLSRETLEGDTASKVEECIYSLTT